jgi:hypothetical protein
MFKQSFLLTLKLDGMQLKGSKIKELSSFMESDNESKKKSIEK